MPIYRSLLISVSALVISIASGSPLPDDRGGPTESFYQIDLPSEEEAPNGTAVTASMLGVYATSGRATFETYSDGERYIKVTSGNKFSFTADSAAVIDAASHYAYEFGIRYVLSKGESWPEDDIHQSVVIESAGDTQFKLTSRPKLNLDGILVTVLSENMLTASSTTLRNHGNILRDNEPVRIGMYCSREEDGYMGVKFDGMIVGHLSGVDGTKMSSLQGFGRFTPVDGQYLESHLTGPIRVWRDDSFVSEMIIDRQDDSLGLKARWYDQITLDLGPFEKTDGISNVQLLRYVFGGGAQQKRFRFRTSGPGGATLELRPEHALGQLDKMSEDRACLVFPMIYSPGVNSLRIELGDQNDSDVMDLLFDGASGVTSAHPIFIGGVDTGLTYDHSRRYKLSILFDEADDASSLILEDLTSLSITAVRLFGAHWNRPGGIPSVNKIKMTIDGFFSEIEPPVNTPSMDILLASSYLGTSSTNVSPTMSNTNHIGYGWDHYPNAASREATGILSFAPFSRSGRSITQMDEGLDQYVPFEHMRGCRIVAGEWVVNNAASVLTVVQEMKLLVSACFQNQVRLLLCTSIPRPANGPNNISDAYRQNQREINDQVKQLVLGLDRPDLFMIADVAAEYTDAQAADTFFNTVFDDIHFRTEGDLLYAERVLELMTPACRADMTEDQMLDIFDVFAFIQLFNDENPIANLNGDEEFDIFDVFVFIEIFNAGCY